ncbi:LysR family transcriptional regulator [Lentzea sp. NPDC058450]|uniref:LysR family transcriptional regulator n=1 Tax=Lentzea sp. NPDC058450 TaxID=3346505 RepID=UPI003666359A
MERPHPSAEPSGLLAPGTPVTHQDWASLRIFLEIARELSFTRAAERLCVSQPTVSRQIAQLERRCARQLVVRTSRSVRLTAAGLELAGRLSAAMQAIEATLASAGPVPARSPALRLGLFQVPQVALTGHLAEQHRGGECRWEATSPELGARRVAAGELDVYCGVWCADVVPVPDDGLRCLSVLTVPMWVAASANHPVARASGADLADLGDEHWVSPADRHLREAFHLACERAGVRPRIRAVTDDTAEIAAVVRADLAIALVTPWATRPASLPARPCSNAPELTLVVATRPAAPPSLRRAVAEAARGSLWRSAVDDRGLRDWFADHPRRWTMSEVTGGSAGHAAGGERRGEGADAVHADGVDPGQLAHPA